MRSVIRGLAFGMALCLGTAAAQAVVRGATDTFEDGSTQGWRSGSANPSQPSNVASGGPAGADDNYLVTLANGGSGVGGKLVVIAGSQWLGDYIAAGVSAITMDVNNFGAVELSLRLVLIAGGNTAISSDAVVVPAGSGWARASFSLDPALLTASLGSSAATTLAGVTDLRLFHGTQAVFPGPNVVAQLGMDNVAAVPEPGAAALLACGLLVLAWRKAGRSSRRLRPPFG